MNFLKKMGNAALFSFLFLFVIFNIYFPVAVSAEAVILISSASDLEQIRNDPSGDFKLMADIELSEEFAPISSFSGTLDGNGHVISDLTITANANQPKAAFIVENNGIIERIGFADVDITGISTNSSYWAGGIVATNKGTIQQSFVTGSVVGGYRSAGIAVTNYGTIRNSYSVVNVNAKVESGALVAVSESGSMLETSYAVPNVNSELNNTGGISAYAYTNAVIKNNALLAGTITNGSNSNIARIVGRSNGSPTIENNVASEKAFVQGSVVTGGKADNNQGLSIADNMLTLQSTYEDILSWDFYSVWEISSVLGRPQLRNVSESKAIEIATVSDLEQIRNNSSGDFKLTADIELSEEFAPVSSFSGTLNGNGHVISDLTITASTNQPKAAFIIENDGIIERIGFADVDITGISTNSSYWAGGIVATNKGTIQQSFVTGSVVGGYRSAGIAVTNYGMVRNSYSVANVKAKVESGALVAVSESGSVLETSYAVPNVNSELNNTGGISAYAYTNAMIKNNALLAGTITNGSNSNIARITGRSNGSPIFQSNVASENAFVQGAVVTGGRADNNQGLSITDNELTLQSTYEDILSWDFYSVWEKSSVLGRPQLRNVSESKAIEIATVSDLEQIRNNPSSDFKLIADIELSEEFVPISSFSGTLNGNGHVISGLTITANTNQPKAAFIIENNGIIERIGFIDVDITGISTNSSYWAGGIVATNKGMIQQSFVTGSVVGGYRSAGIAVTNYGMIRNSYSVVNVNAKVEGGALVAVSESDSVLETSYAVPNVNSELNNTGGISAYAYTNAMIKNNALLAGTITNGSNNNIARIVGRSNGSPTFQNNVASENTLVQGVIVTEGEANNNQGLSVANGDLVSRSIYEDRLDWNFNEIWMFNSALGRPVLRNFNSSLITENNPVINIVLRDETEELSKGVMHRQMDFLDNNGNIQKANIIDVDINLPQNKIIVGIKDDEIPPTDENGNYIRIEDNEGHDIIRENVAMQATTTEAIGKDVIAGVNGEFYTKMGPEGYMIKDGSSVINGVRVPGVDGKNYPFHGFFGIKTDGTAIIGDYGEDWQQEKDSLLQASGGQFWIVKDGIVQDFNGQVISGTNHPDYDGETYYRHKDRHPRTAVGIREDGSVFFVVVDGRGANDSVGLYIEELGRFMKELGAYQSLNMDGGGSSTAVALDKELGEYEIKNTPINKVNGVNIPGVPRDVFSSLLVLVDQPNVKLNVDNNSLIGVTAHNFPDDAIMIISRWNKEGTTLLDSYEIDVSDANSYEQGKYISLSQPMFYNIEDQIRLHAWDSFQGMTSIMTPQIVGFGEDEINSDNLSDIEINNVSYDEIHHTFPLSAMVNDYYHINEQSEYALISSSAVQDTLSATLQTNGSYVTGTITSGVPKGNMQMTALVLKETANPNQFTADDIVYISEIPTNENGEVNFSFFTNGVSENYYFIFKTAHSQRLIYQQ